MTDLDPYQSVEGRYIKIIALLPENDLPVEERNNLHLCESLVKELLAVKTMNERLDILEILLTF